MLHYACQCEYQQKYYPNVEFEMYHLCRSCVDDPATMAEKETNDEMSGLTATTPTETQNDVKGKDTSQNNSSYASNKNVSIPGDENYDKDSVPRREQNNEHVREENNDSKEKMIYLKKKVTKFQQITAKQNLMEKRKMMGTAQKKMEMLRETTPAILW